MNEAARLIDYSNGNQEDVLKGVGLDSRIGSHYFRPSPAWGGSCFPKDVKALHKSEKSQYCLQAKFLRKMLRCKRSLEGVKLAVRVGMINIL